MLRRSILRMGLALSLLVAACGGNAVSLDTDASVGPDADPNAPDADPYQPDADPSAPDARIPPGCVPGKTQCSNCLDDDHDLKVDGDDPECTGSADNSEGSFSTGIPGDNKDSRKQDCFFDGNSGGSPTRDCIYHTCCLLDNPLTAANECPEDLRQGYDATKRAESCGMQSQGCKDFCKPLTPPGCDCFGCCTVCTGTDCRDLLINTAVTPTCDYSNLAGCLSCTKSPDCAAAPCSGTSCVLCPGQTESDLPSTCTGQNACPTDLTVCDGPAQCTISQSCTNGCCIDAVD